MKRSKFFAYLAILLITLTVLIGSMKMSGILYSEGKSISGEDYFTKDPDKIYKHEEPMLWSQIQEWKIENSGYQYQIDPQLCEMAKIRNQFVYKNFSHDGFAELAEDWIEDLPYNYIAENLYKGRNPANDALEVWLNSPPHREALESNDYTHSCLSCEKQNCVHLFGAGPLQP